jgi:hypothetical protein
MQKYSNLREKYLVHNTQKKFQLSVLDWTPNTDWVILIVLFAIGVLVAGFFAYQTYLSVIDIMNSDNGQVVKAREFNIEEFQEFKAQRDSDAQILNSLR